MTDRHDATDWAGLAGEMAAIRARLVHEQQSPLHGVAFEAEALRQLLDSHMGRQWLSTRAETTSLVEAHTVVDRMRAESAEQDAQRARRQARETAARHRGDTAAWIRHAVNPRTVPSRYRREGALMVAEWLDGRAAQ